MSALTLILCVGVVGAASRVLERGNGPEPDSLDPARAQGLSSHQILRDLYEGLLIEAVDGQLAPGVANSWSTDASGLDWTFELDSSARFADGRPVVAADFVTALNRALDPATAAPYAGALLPIKGARERLAGSGTILAVTALGDQRLRISLSHPSLDLPQRLTLPIAFPIDSRTVNSHDASDRPHINGNGPYQLIEWKPGAWIELAPNPHHPGASRLAIRRVRFHVTEDAASEVRRFEAGELHLTETVPPQPLHQLSARYGTQLKIGPSMGTFYLGYNLRLAPFAEQPALREALSLAIDRELLVRVVTGTGESPAYGLLPPSLATIKLEAPGRQDRLVRARSLYRAAGYDHDRPLQVELRYNTSSLNRRLMLAVAAMWEEQLGVRTRLRNEDWKVFVRNRRAGTITQVFRGGWNADFADPLNFLEPFSSDSPLNSTGYADPQFDAALRAAGLARSMPARDLFLQDAHALLLSAHAIIPLFHYTTKHLVSDEIEGFTANPLDHHSTRHLRWRETTPQ